MIKISIHRATSKDINKLAVLMCHLAEYEKLPSPGKMIKKRLQPYLSKTEPKIYALLAMDGDKAVGYALYFYTFSSFLLRPTLFLEDLFILKEYRRLGIGENLFNECVKIGKKKGCARMEWVVLDWNKPAHHFYRKTGARILKEWIPYRLKLRKSAF